MNFIFYFLMRDLEPIIKLLIPFFDFELKYLENYQISNKKAFDFVFENFNIENVNELEIDIKSLILRKDFSYDNFNFINVLNENWINEHFKVGIKDNKEFLVFDEVEDFNDLILALDICFSNRV